MQRDNRNAFDVIFSALFCFGIYFSLIEELVIEVLYSVPGDAPAVLLIS
jgi:hypothetical protein